MQTANTKETKPQAVEFANVGKWFGDFRALKNINLTVGDGERIVICGPSGSGSRP